MSCVVSFACGKTTTNIRVNAAIFRSGHYSSSVRRPPRRLKEPNGESGQTGLGALPRLGAAAGRGLLPGQLPTQRQDLRTRARKLRIDDVASAAHRAGRAGRVSRVPRRNLRTALCSGLILGFEKIKSGFGI